MDEQRDLGHGGGQHGGEPGAHVRHGDVRASPKASYVTGAVFAADGGQMAV
jgi:hypothetical protein